MGNAKAEAITDAESRKLCKKQKSLSQEFEKAMDDDFNTADAVAAVFDLGKIYQYNIPMQKALKNICRNLFDLACRS